MNTKSRLFTAAGVVAVASTASSPVLAAGTQSGTSVQNTVNVTYTVGGVQQTAATGSDTFVIDRKINLSVSELGGSATSVAPNQQDAVTTFQLTNSSNDTLDFGLAAANLANNSAGKFGGTDSFDVSNLRIYRETGAQAGLQTTGANADILVTDYVDEIAPDANITLYVLGNIPNPQANGTKAVVSLTATALAGGATGTKGATLVNDTANANVAGTVQNVFADPAANGNAQYNGQASDTDDYLVAAAALAAAKTASILWDPVNGTTRPKMIPGAVVEYCIAVANGSPAATATGVNLSDNLPTQTKYLPNGSVASGTGVAENTGIGIVINGDGSVSGSGASATATCTGGGAAGGTFTAGPPEQVAASLNDIPAATTRTLRFRVVVQ